MQHVFALPRRNQNTWNRR